MFESFSDCLRLPLCTICSCMELTFPINDAVTSRLHSGHAVHGCHFSSGCLIPLSLMRFLLRNSMLGAEEAHFIPIKGPLWNV